MKKLLCGILFFAIYANSAITQQKALIGNWTLATSQKTEQSLDYSLEKDSLNLNEKDWKFSQVSIYDIKKNPDVKFKLRMSIDGEYRLDKIYPKNFSAEIIDASDEELAHKSFKEAEKMIKDEIIKMSKSLTFSSATETELKLESLDGSLSITYSKPKNLPVSKLINDTVPFFAPEGWRYPENAKELADFPIRIKNDSKNLFTLAKGDFNGDGVPDAVAYLLNPEEGRVALFLNISKDDGSHELGPYGNADRNTIIENGVIIAPPGEYVNSVTKAKITIENLGFMTVIFGENTSLVYWDSKKNDWATIPLGKKF